MLIFSARISRWIFLWVVLTAKSFLCRNIWTDWCSRCVCLLSYHSFNYVLGLVHYFSVFSIHRNVLASSTVTATSVVVICCFCCWFVGSFKRRFNTFAPQNTQKVTCCFLFWVCCYCSQAAFSTHSISWILNANRNRYPFALVSLAHLWCVYSRARINAKVQRTNSCDSDFDADFWVTWYRSCHGNHIRIGSHTIYHKLKIQISLPSKSTNGGT